MSQEIQKAVILGLWGDPGLTELNQAAFFSRFLIVQIIEDNVFAPIGKNGPFGYIQLILRPKHLWITQSNQSAVGVLRSDSFGKANKIISGNPADNSVTFETNNIQPILKPYKAGEVVNIRRLDSPLTIDNNRIFEGVDVFARDGILPPRMSDAYKNNSYIVGPPGWSTTNIKSCLDSNSIYYFPFGAGANFSYFVYLMCVYRYLSLIGGTLAGNLQFGAFSNQFLNFVASRRGGLFRAYSLPQVSYIDLNTDNRTRDCTVDHCVPLVVANPSTFPTPVVRNVGGVNITL